MRRPWHGVSMGVALAAVAAPSAAAELRDLYFGEALYQAYQGHYFDAERLDAEMAQHRRVDEPQLDDRPVTFKRFCIWNF